MSEARPKLVRSCLQKSGAEAGPKLVRSLPEAALRRAGQKLYVRRRGVWSEGEWSEGPAKEEGGRRKEEGGLLRRRVARPRPRPRSPRSEGGVVRSSPSPAGYAEEGGGRGRSFDRQVALSSGRQVVVRRRAVVGGRRGEEETTKLAQTLKRSCQTAVTRRLSALSLKHPRRHSRPMALAA